MTVINQLDSQETTNASSVLNLADSSSGALSVTSTKVSDCPKRSGEWTVEPSARKRAAVQYEIY